MSAPQLPFGDLATVFGDPADARHKARTEAMTMLRAAFDKIDPDRRLDDVANDIEEWAAVHLDEASKEIRAWIKGTRKMAEERHAIIENINDLLGDLCDSFDEEDARARMIRILVQRVKRQRDQF
jgi:hypothetical protein